MRNPNTTDWHVPLFAAGVALLVLSYFLLGFALSEPPFPETSGDASVTMPVMRCIQVPQVIQPVYHGQPRSAVIIRGEIAGTSPTI